MQQAEQEKAATEEKSRKAAHEEEERKRKAARQQVRLLYQPSYYTLSCIKMHVPCRLGRLVWFCIVRAKFGGLWQDKKTYEGIFDAACNCGDYIPPHSRALHALTEWLSPA